LGNPTAGSRLSKKSHSASTLVSNRQNTSQAHSHDLGIKKVKDTDKNGVTGLAEVQMHYPRSQDKASEAERVSTHKHKTDASYCIHTSM
jgi:hypothetical protein